MNAVFKTQVEIIEAMATANQLAKKCGRVSQSIFELTSIKPVDRLVGGAALLAPNDCSQEQQERVKAALDHLKAAEELLYDAAISGGLTQEKLHRITEDDPMTFDVYMTDEEKKEITISRASNSENISLQN